MKKYVNAEENIDMLTSVQIAALADIFENSEGLLPEENLEKAMRYYKMAAEMGDAYAQSALANAYTVGRDVEKSDELALFWYKKAAEQGNPYAQYELGKRLRDEDGGLLWLYLSAKQGFAAAMKELSDRLRNIDSKESKKWLRRYYRNRGKNDAWRWFGKKYVRELRRTVQPEVIDGEVVIKI